MILKGSQRAGGNQLALHLLRTDDNEHVEVHEVRGFMSENLKSALQEAYAISRGTRCRQYLFSLSLSPPETERVPVPVFEEALTAIEEKLGLAGQPRAIVFHEKEGRRHAHCVWSRIDAEEMKAINLRHFKLKLRDVSRQLYIDHGWKMPNGLVNSQERDPRNFSRAEWQQAKRAGHDPRALKEMFQECWAISDSGKAFASALAARGLYLARGDRRGFVAVDYRGETYAIAKWTGLRTRGVAVRLGKPEDLPSVAETKAQIAAMMTDMLRRHINETESVFRARAQALRAKRTKLTDLHRGARQMLKDKQATRWVKETRERSARLSHGLRGLWDRLTGRHVKISRQNEEETIRARDRDQAERQALIDQQLEQRRRLQSEIRQVRHGHTMALAMLHRDVANFMRLGQGGQEILGPSASRRQRRSLQRGSSPSPE